MSRNVLRVRRYVDGTLLDDRELTTTTTEVLGGADARWAAEQTAAGRRFRIVIDDPDGELGACVVLAGGPA
jgi:hypothetical protein